MVRRKSPFVEATLDDNLLFVSVPPEQVVVSVNVTRLANGQEQISAILAPAPIPEPETLAFVEVARG